MCVSSAGQELPCCKALVKCHFPRETSEVRNFLPSRQLASQGKYNFTDLKKILFWKMLPMKLSDVCHFYFGLTGNKLLPPSLETQMFSQRKFSVWFLIFLFIYFLLLIIFFHILVLSLSVKVNSGGVTAGQERLAKINFILTNHV